MMLSASSTADVSRAFRATCASSFRNVGMLPAIFAGESSDAVAVRGV